MGESRPLLLAADVAITIHDDSDDSDEMTMPAAQYPPRGRRGSGGGGHYVYTSLRTAAVSPKQAQMTHMVYYQQQQQQQQLASMYRKYVTYPVEDPVGQKRGRSQVAAMYGSMSLQPNDDGDDECEDQERSQRKDKTTLRSLLCKLDDPARRTKKDVTMSPEKITGLYHKTTSPPGSNQSETESDSDGSCGSNSTSSLQSILRIRDGVYACRKVKKHVSVEFALDIDEEENKRQEKALLKKTSSLSCASSCMPRRLTLEEKAALYRVRPDLQLTPMPLILRELEEIRRRRQRKLMFSILGGTLIMLMVIVFYYMLTEAQ
uniref:Uncharacterized protein n=1 Tax=Globisporangium ultimum (strain ATCC 200006 / CBS 805.95 / DAOM BR144) TaxID=431595 RepID=K3WI96_GLOUD